MKLFLVYYIPSRLAGRPFEERARHARVRLFHTESEADAYVKEIDARDDIRLHDYREILTGGGEFDLWPF
jgi:hypothetical protein